jgi:hypothetical protein
VRQHKNARVQYRKSRGQRLSPSEAHESTTKSDGMWNL